MIVENMNKWLCYPSDGKDVGTLSRNSDVAMYHAKNKGRNNYQFFNTEMNQLSALGFEISVDDFGTGYSSLSFLKRYPINTLKIDRSFVNDITSDPDDAVISAAIIALAHSLNMKVVAEGIETKPRLDFLTEQKCDRYQGYYFSRTLPAKGIEKMLIKA